MKDAREKNQCTEEFETAAYSAKLLSDLLPDRDIYDARRSEFATNILKNSMRCDANELCVLATDRSVLFLQLLS